MDKRLIVACVVVFAFLFSGGGVIIFGVGIIASMTGISGAAFGGDDSGGGGGGAPAGTVCDPGGATLQAEVPGYGPFTVTKEQMGNAAVIVNVGDQEHVPEKGEVIAIMTALQESSLENLNYGDRDSLGLFQQRPSAGWGTPQEITTPSYAAKAFYGGPDHPSPPGLLSIANWQQMPPGQAAQAVQVSAFPDAYAKWEGLAGQIVGRAKSVSCSTVGVSGDVGKVIDAAKRWLGTPYCWAGGDANGPTYTPDCPAGVDRGFDCSGLTLYAYAQVGIVLGHYTGDQWNAGQRVRSYSELRPGDLMFWSSDGTEQGIHHVSMYLGNDQMIHAPHTGSTVQIVDHVSQNSYWMKQFIGGTRLLQDTGGGKSPSPSPSAASRAAGQQHVPQVSLDERQVAVVSEKRWTASGGRAV